MFKKHLVALEPRFEKIIEASPECPMGTPQGVETYPYLFKAILYQQLSTLAARAISDKIKNYFGGDYPVAEVVLDLPEEILRDLGLSRMKVSYMKSLAECELSGELPAYKQLLRMQLEDIRQQLSAIKGVGPWTVDMLLMFNLGHEDIMPALDYGVQKGYALLMGCQHPRPKELLAATERLSPYRSYAAWYLWRVVDDQGVVQNSDW